MGTKVFQRMSRFSLAFVLLFTTCMQAIAEEGVVLTLKSGQEVAFIFTSKPRITTNEVLTITTQDKTEVSYEYDEVRNIRFGEFTSTGLKDIAGNEDVDVSFKISNGVLYVYGLTKGEKVGVYNLAGQCVAHQQQTTDNAMLSIQLSVNGIVVVRTSSGISYRVMIP